MLLTPIVSILFKQGILLKPPHCSPDEGCDPEFQSFLNKAYCLNVKRVEYFPESLFRFNPF